MVSLLTLILPWAGCQFIRETESALREGQQQMLGGTAQAIADSLSQFPDEMLSGDGDGDRIYAHPLASAPLIDGYVDDWTIPDGALAVMRGVDGPIRYVLGQTGQHWYLYVEVRDDTIVYAGARDQATFDQAYLTSIDPSGRVTTIRFRAEAPGRILAVRHEGAQSFDETRIEAHWEDSPDGYRIEARIPRSLLAGRFGLSVYDAGDASSAGVTSNSFRGNAPGPVVTISPVLQSVATGYVQPGWRLMILDRQGWRIASVGSVNVCCNACTPMPPSKLRMSYTPEIGGCTPPAVGGSKIPSLIRQLPSPVTWNVQPVVMPISKSPLTMCSGVGLLGIVGQLSQRSPKPSRSVSIWSGLNVSRQLSQASPTPSLSVSP